MVAQRPATFEDGFSMIEVVVATAVLVVGVVGLAQLSLVGAKANAEAGRTTTAAILAQQKMEALRSTSWGSGALAPSPVDALAMDRIGYVDYLDAGGRVLGDGTAPLPPDARYVRRWAIAPLPSDPVNGLILQVLVQPRVVKGGSGAPSGPGRARIVSVRSRWD